MLSTTLKWESQQAGNRQTACVSASVRVCSFAPPSVQMLSESAVHAEDALRGAISPRHPRTPHLPCTRHQPSIADVLCLSPSQVCESCGRCPDIMTLQARYLLEVDAVEEHRVEVQIDVVLIDEEADRRGDRLALRRALVLLAG